MHDLPPGDAQLKQSPFRFLLAACSGTLILILCLAFAGHTQRAAAQAAATARISALDTSEFPQVQLYLDLHAANGEFIAGVEGGQVTILENNRRIPPAEFRQTKVGVQFVTAITLGPSFGVRDGLGMSRYEYVAEGLQGWQWVPESGDDLSLTISGGPELVHSASQAEWLQALQSFQPDTRQATPNLQLLSRALDIAADPSPQPGMDRMVLFITPPLGVEASVGLQSLAGRAQQEGTHINIWMVGAPEYQDSVQATLLQDIAAQTSGSYFFFSGTEPFPDLEEYLRPMRAIYNLSYTSAITTTGAFPVKVEINTAEASLLTPDKLVQFDVRPPNPVFVAAPTEILRTLAVIPTSDPMLQATTIPPADRLVPAEQALQILVEFPDGRTRPLQRSALYVNGVLAVEHTQPPFDQFTWNLQSITQTQQILLRVEVTDNLGLTSSTVELPVLVTVQTGSRNRFGMISTRSLILTAVTVGLAGIVLALVLVIGGRIRPRVFGRPEGQRASLSRANTRPLRGALGGPVGQVKTISTSRKSQASRHLDPVTQPVNIPQPPASSHRRWALPTQLHIPVIPALKWSSPHVENKRSEVFLEPLPASEESAPEAPLALSAEKIIIGHSAGQATLILNEPTVEALHATLQREGGSFRLQDAGSTAGTWLNFTPVPEQGVLLQHGDLIHFGHVGFRFTLRSPGHTRKPAITPYPMLPQSLKALYTTFPPSPSPKAGEQEKPTLPTDGL